VKASSVRLRARKYDHLFEMEDARVTLRQPETPQPEYPVRLSPFAKAEGGGWLAEVPDLPGCISDGQTREEAIHNVEDAIAARIPTAREFDDTVPLPGGGDRPSGRWVMRVSKTLHRRLAERARAEGVSLNARGSQHLAEGNAFWSPRRQ